MLASAHFFGFAEKTPTYPHLGHTKRYEFFRQNLKKRWSRFKHSGQNIIGASVELYMSDVRGVMSACWRRFGLCCGEKHAFVGSASSHDIVMTSNQSSINGWTFFWIRADVPIFKKHNSFHLKRWKNQCNMSKYQTSSQNIHQNLLFF